MKLLFLFILLPAAFVETFVYHRFGLSLIGAVWLALAAQADWAAKRFLREGLVWKELPATEASWLPPEEEPEVVVVKPLGKKSRRAHSEDQQPKQAAPEPKPRPQPAPSASPAPGSAQPRRKIRELPKAPNFRGRAHEILGIPESAATITIVNAFRLWIKRFHPDPSGAAPSANERARRLVEAKQNLLRKRQQNRGNKAA